MTSLLYRELYLQRKGIIALIGVFFGFIGLLMLVYLSLLYGNMGILYDEEEQKEMIEVIYTINTFFPGFLVLLMPAGAFETVASDYAVGWMRFQHCLPYTPMQYAAVKIILMVAELLLGLALGLGNAVVSSRIFGLNLDFKGTLVMLLLMMTFCCVASLLSVLLTLFLRSKNSNAVAIMVIAAYIIGVVVIALLPESAYEKLEVFLTGAGGNGDAQITIANVISKVADYLKTLLPLCLGITAAALTGGFFAITALFKRREN